MVLVPKKSWVQHKTLNESGNLFLTHTKLNGKVVLRMVIGQTDVEENHIKDAWQRIVQTAEALVARVQKI